MAKRGPQRPQADHQPREVIFRKSALRLAFETALGNIGVSLPDNVKGPVLREPVWRVSRRP